MQANEWISIKNLSLAAFTRNAGFDLSIYHQYSDGVKLELKKHAINHAVRGIRDSFGEKGIDIAGIKKGVYVISLSSPLSIQYRNGTSQVIYIGMGNLMNRIKGHFQHSLFDFMQSLSGANFDFNFCKPEHPLHDDLHKHIEYLLLRQFSETYGGTANRRKFPLLNKNAGSNKRIEGITDWWKKPLKNSGKKPLWTLTATTHSDFAAID